MFIMPVTVPLNWPPTSMGTAHAGPMTNSRKKNDVARHRTEVQALSVMAAGTRNTPESRNPGAATMLRERRALPVIRNIRSEREPPTRSPAIPANSGTEPIMPRACSVK